MFCGSLNAAGSWLLLNIHIPGDDLNDLPECDTIHERVGITAGCHATPNPLLGAQSHNHGNRCHTP